ncbi:hypothetical protein [Saccharospirillum mangrovi]|uniref:hypothetical protein n=1 Tax=Saccharospirillum mangrovi TaxID=2161747 RepID=UPI000D37FFE2|nr:hypothetical protein [Saccharospirillum mangrovi]
MAGIDRSDSIRRPVDSTLSTRTAHRGGEGLLQPQADVIAQLRQSAPAIAVVVEQHNLGSPTKPLFELLLSMNEQWVKVQSNKPFQPGTVLLVEATRDDQIRVLPKPEPAQLNRMMQASLQFWQAHTLPKVHPTELPTLPPLESRQQLATQQPELKPLLDWLGQKPALNAQTVANWLRDFLPLATPQRQSVFGTMVPAATAPALPIPTIPEGDLPRSDPVVSPKPAPTQTSAPSATATTTPVTQLLPLLNAIRTSLPVQQHTPIQWVPVQQQPTGQWQLWQPTQHSAPTNLIASQAALQQLTPAATPTELPKLTAPVMLISSTLSANQQSAPLPLQLIDVQQLQQPQRFATPLAISPETRPVLHAALSALQPQLALPRWPLPASLDVLAALSGSLTTAGGSQQPPLAGNNTNWQSLPGRLEPSGRVPLEIRLAQWLVLIDDRIRQNPASLQQSLAQRAQHLLRGNDLNYGLDRPLPPPPLPQIHNSHTAHQQSAAELQPLVQLRHWLEAVQGKTQNNAIQQTLSALTQSGDAAPNPVVQQLSIPLVWMGPSAWANLEWWQEQASEEETASSGRSKRLWRFRLFFELEPLAPLCADLIWEPKHTEVTFWSEDRSTLAFLNSQISTLEQWTEGLGERQLHTRHGMPRKKSTPEPDAFKPLVDVHT